MYFEFDPTKSEVNRKKHGIDFTQAQALWRDPMRLNLMANSTIEKRYALIAQSLGKVWFAVYALRQMRIRIISVRRARNKEVDIYEKE